MSHGAWCATTMLCAEAFHYPFETWKRGMACWPGTVSSLE
jgi:hypothetical protein